MGSCSSLFLCWPMKEVRVGWLTATVKSWPAVTDREAGALTLIAGWQASCFLQQGNICRNTQQIYQSTAMHLESTAYPPQTALHQLNISSRVSMVFLIKCHCFSLLSNSTTHCPFVQDLEKHKMTGFIKDCD